MREGHGLARWPFVLALAVVCWWAGEERQHRLHRHDYAAGYVHGREDEGRAALRVTPYLDVRPDGKRVVFYGACYETRPRTERLP
jgi:hypothetical protein